jgi:hypothetical protein
VSLINEQTIQDNYGKYNKAIQSKTVMDGTTQRNWRVMMEASAYPFPWVLDVAEFILLWDGPAGDYEIKYNGYLQGPNTNYPTPDWWCNVPDLGTTTGPERIVHTIWNYKPGDPQNPPDMAGITDVLKKVQGRCAGSLYLTDNKDGKVLGLPPYFEQEVDAVRGGA